MGMSDLLSEIVVSIVKKMVDKENEVSASVNVSTKNIIIQIKASKDDLGKIIGKKGRSIEALKIIISAIKNTKFSGDPRNVCIEILEDEQTKFEKKYREDR